MLDQSWCDTHCIEGDSPGQQYRLGGQVLSFEQADVALSRHNLGTVHKHHAFQACIHKAGERAATLHVHPLNTKANDMQQSLK